MVEVHAFPHDDADFRSRVEAGLVDVTERDRASLVEAVRRLVGELRPQYPLVRIRIQDRLAALDDQVIVYAYRDGTAVGPGRHAASDR
ncbi:MAG TPA: hypothetical protein VFI28_07385 [Candidatus Limnocylindrales bacterium]|nr:hypothetical protein [Candidatus Limnocylindrales bacterium]